MASTIGNDASTRRGRGETDRERIGVRMLVGTIAGAGLVMAVAILLGASSVNVETLFAPLWR